jgi:hypothetical protein
LNVLPDEEETMMNLARNPKTHRDVDLQRTRRAFLFAREQLASNLSSGRYPAPRELRNGARDRATLGDPAAADSPESPRQ